MWESDSYSGNSRLRMRKKSILEKSNEYYKQKRLREIRNAKRGAARPWDLTKVRQTIKPHLHHKEKLDLFNKNIGRIFPLILDMTAQGYSLRSIERQMNLTSQMLWRWLQVRGELGAMVREARGLRGRTDHGLEGIEAP